MGDGKLSCELSYVSFNVDPLANAIAVVMLNFLLLRVLMFFFKHSIIISRIVFVTFYSS